MYTLLYERRVFKDFDKIDRKNLARIDRTIRRLSQNPLPPGTRKLVGEVNTYRIRQGTYRIIFTVDHKTKEVRIFGVRHRKRAYRK